MNKNLEEIIKIYSTKSHGELSSTLLGYSKDNIIAQFIDLLTLYINDKNSSTLREFLTVSLAGYSHNTKKIGFDGFRQTVNNEPLNCDKAPKYKHTRFYRLQKRIEKESSKKT